MHEKEEHKLNDNENVAMFKGLNTAGKKRVNCHSYCGLSKVSREIQMKPKPRNMFAK